jgi:hypothetical protein
MIHLRNEAAEETLHDAVHSAEENASLACMSHEVSALRSQVSTPRNHTCCCDT